MSQLGGDLYSWARDAVWRPEDQIKKIADAQTKAFDKLENNLKTLQAAVNGGSQDRSQALKALDQAMSDARTLRTSNENLYQRLVLAREENAKLVAIAAKAGGPMGGHDFVLATGEGMRIDKTTTVGVTQVGDTWVYMNLTAKNHSNGAGGYVSLGGSMSYQGADGKVCKVGPVSISGTNQRIATFVQSCI